MEKTKFKPSPTVLAIVIWMAINIVIMVLSILSGDQMDPNNWLEIGLWTSSIIALLFGRKWGIAFSIFTLTYTLSTSLGIVLYYEIWINAIRAVLNAAAIIYLYRILLTNNKQSNKETKF